MADEILQKLGFDATDALSTLAALETGFNKFNAALNSVAAGVKAFNAASGGTGGALKQTNATTREAARIFEQTRMPLERYQITLAKLDGLAQQGAISQDTHARAVQQAATALEAASKSGKSMWVSWETLGRVLQTQIIVRSLNAIRDALEFAYESQIKFAKALSEIKAIDPSRTLAQIAVNVRELSDAFNQPLAIVAEAQYQVLSDQFTSAADRANILTAANQLAKTTEDDLVASTQLLTGALNAYGESSSMAGLRAAQFFEAINLGRFRASELGTALGRVQTIGHELGVSMEELQASLITITIGGVKASEAATQLRGILTALLKPSEGMKKALKDIGVESGEAAIRTWGLQGALEAIKGSTDGSSAALGKLLPNIRGAAGALRLLSEGAEKHKEAMESLSKIDQSVIAGKAIEAMSTDAARLTAELNKLRNFFTVELGADIVGRLNTLINLLGGGKGLVGVLRLITSETPKALAVISLLYLATARWGTSADVAFAKWTTGWRGFQNGVALGLKSLATLRGALTLLAVWETGRILGQQIGGWIEERIVRPFEREREEFQKSIEMNKRRADAIIREKGRENDELSKKLLQYLTEANKVYMQDADNFEKAMKLHEKSVKRAFDNILGDYRRLTQELFSASEAAAKKAAEATQKVAEIQQGIADRRFRAQVARWEARPDQQFSMYAERARQLGDAAAKLQASAKDENQQRAADLAWQRAKAFDDAATSAAQQTGHLGYQNRALELSISLENKRADAIKRQGQMQAQLTKETAERGRQAETHLEMLTSQRDELEQLINAWTKDEKGASILKSPQQARKDLDEYDRMIKVWAGNVQKYATGDFLKNFMGDVKAFESLKREAERMLASIYLKDLQVAPETVAKLWDDLQKSADQVRIKVKVVVDVEALTGMKLEQVGMTGLMTEFGKITEKNIERLVRQAQLMKDIGEAQERINRALETGVSFPVERGKVGRGLERLGILSPHDPALIAGMVRQIELLSKKTEISAEEMAKLDGIINSPKFKEALSHLSLVDQQKFIDMADAIRKLKEAQDALKTVGPVDQRENEKVRAIQEQINALPVKVQLEKASADQSERQKNAAKATGTAIDNQTSSINNGLPSVASLEQAWWGVASAAQAAASAAAAASMGGGLEVGYAGEEFLYSKLGGMIQYFDKGGSARGLDRIPAMLSPGEFVMSPAATKRWYSQLVAMNAGFQPAYRSQGGNITGIAGDVTVNVQGGRTGAQTAREIAANLNREIRRGTARLRSVAPQLLLR